MEVVNIDELANLTAGILHRLLICSHNAHEEARCMSESRKIKRSSLDIIEKLGHCLVHDCYRARKLVDALEVPPELKDTPK